MTFQLPFKNKRMSVSHFFPTQQTHYSPMCAVTPMNPDPKGLCGVICHVVLLQFLPSPAPVPFPPPMPLLLSRPKFCVQGLGRLCLLHGVYPGCLQRVLLPQGRTQLPLGGIQGASAIPTARNGGYALQGGLCFQRAPGDKGG